MSSFPNTCNPRLHFPFFVIILTIVFQFSAEVFIADLLCSFPYEGFENHAVSFYEGWANHGISISRMDARLVSNVFLGDLLVKVEMGMGGSPPTFGPDIRVNVENSVVVFLLFCLSFWKNKSIGLTIIGLVLTGLIIVGPTDGAIDCENMGMTRIRWGSKSFEGGCWIAWL
ncbi:hypothetical protein Tco_0725560 [Tanacetum coccineum]|uniref:Uncharacterized protein n=1 Tax=Tanacetum coccineum TaxID=301880 RepID=A0ABQ4YD72_9ASTR